MATTQDSNDRNYSDAEKIERAIGSRLTEFKSSKKIIVRTVMLPDWIVEIDRAAINPISTDGNTGSAGSPGSLSTGRAVAGVSRIHSTVVVVDDVVVMVGDAGPGVSNGLEAPGFINTGK